MAHDGSPAFISTEMRTLLECPVCVQTYRNPKSLPCGHSVCAECCRSLNQQRVNLMCPVCRNVCHLSAENLPINFGLRDLVQHHVEISNDSASNKPFLCVRCDKRLNDDDSWLCSTCRAIVCCSCALRHHQTHNLQEMKNLVVQKETQLSGWRANLDSLKSEVFGYRQQIDQNRLRISRVYHSTASMLRTKIMPSMEATSKMFEQKISSLLNRSNDINASRCIADEIAGKETDLTTVPTQYEAVKKEEKDILNKQKDILNALLKLNNVLTDVEPGFANENTANSNNTATAISRSSSSSSSNINNNNNNNNNNLESALRLRSTAVIPRVNVAVNLAQSPRGSGGQRIRSSSFLSYPVISFDDSSDEDIRPVVEASSGSINVGSRNRSDRTELLIRTSGGMSEGQISDEESRPAINRSTIFFPSTVTNRRLTQGIRSRRVAFTTPSSPANAASASRNSTAASSRRLADLEDSPEEMDLVVDSPPVVSVSSLNVLPMALSSSSSSSSAGHQQGAQASLRSVAFKRRAVTVADSSDSESDTSDDNQNGSARQRGTDVDCAIRFRNLTAPKK